VAKRGHAINTGKVLRGAPWQIVIFSLGMYLVVYGLRNAGLTEYLSGVLNVLADKGLWAATFGTGFLTAFLSSIMNNMLPCWLALYRWQHRNRRLSKRR
jgi:arsenical pump membrane protein